MSESASSTAPWRTAEHCEYGAKPSEAYSIDADNLADGEAPKPADVGFILCTWGHDAPEGVKLVNMPVWIQRLAMAGAHMNPLKDCATCTCFSPRRPRGPSIER